MDNRYTIIPLPEGYNYPLTDSRTLHNMDGTVNWEKYSKSLKKKLEELKNDNDDYSNWIEELKSELQKLRDRNQGLQDYIKILDNELNETVTIAYAHGWRSSLVEDGEQAREKLKELGIELNKTKDE